MKSQCMTGTDTVQDKPCSIKLMNDSVNVLFLLSFWQDVNRIGRALFRFGNHIQISDRFLYMNK